MDDQAKLQMEQDDRRVAAETAYKEAKARTMDRVMTLLENLVERLFKIIAEERAKNG